MPVVRSAAAVVDVLELHRLPGYLGARVPRLACSRQRLLVAIALGAALSALSGCGSSGGKNAGGTTTSGATTTSAASWAQGFCVSVTDWKTSVKSAGASVKNANGLSKAKIEQAATSVSDANSKLVSSLKALGEPPHAAAADAKAAVQQLSTDLEASAHEIGKAAANVSGAKGVVSAVSVASTTLLTMATDVSSTITKLESLGATDDWKRAFSDSPACQSLKKS